MVREVGGKDRTSVRIALAQRRSVVGTADLDPRPANLAVAVADINAAAAAGADVVVFGEMFLTGLRTDQWLGRWAVCPDDPHDPTLTELSAACRRHCIRALVGAATRPTRGDRMVHNSIVLIGPDGFRAAYHKQHLARIELPDGTRADEARFYSPGPVTRPLDFDWGRVGLQICYEVTFPEVTRCSMLDGADLVINCTASICGTERLWDAMVRARAFENAVTFIACSVVGQQTGDQYFGGSVCVDPNGVSISQAHYGTEQLLLIDAPVEAARTARRAMNIVAARRPELYSVLTTRDRPPQPLRTRTKGKNT